MRRNRYSDRDKKSAADVLGSSRKSECFFFLRSQRLDGILSSFSLRHVLSFLITLLVYVFSHLARDIHFMQGGGQQKLALFEALFLCGFNTISMPLD